MTSLGSRKRQLHDEGNEEEGAATRDTESGVFPKKARYEAADTTQAEKTEEGRPDLPALPEIRRLPVKDQFSYLQLAPTDEEGGIDGVGKPCLVADSQFDEALEHLRARAKECMDSMRSDDDPSMVELSAYGSFSVLSKFSEKASLDDEGVSVYDLSTLIDHCNEIEQSLNPENKIKWYSRPKQQAELREMWGNATEPLSHILSQVQNAPMTRALCIINGI